MVNVGIDTLAIYTSRYALTLAQLAESRGIDPDKYRVGLGQLNMSVPPPGEDIVTMAANAAKKALSGIDLNDIEMLLFATESGIDQSKAAGTYVHDLLGLPLNCRIVELKQACYAGTAAVQLALPFLRENQHKKILVIASDIARYGLGTTGESSQGAAAIAMVLSANPRIIAFEPEYGVATENAMDFWRPNYLHEALVDGKYSSKLYLTMLEKSFKQYHAKSGRGIKDHAYYCYHSPVPRLVEKAHQYLLKINNERLAEEEANHFIQDALHYARAIGNSYTASLYVGLASLLDLAQEDLAGKRIGFYSYGSGCVAEYFSGIVQPGYQKALHTAYHSKLLARQQLTFREYEEFYRFQYNESGEAQEMPHFDTGCFRLAKLDQHKRIYEKVATTSELFSSIVVEETVSNIVNFTGVSAQDKTAETAQPVKKNASVIQVYAPGKLILSGEHAVVHGQPALAMAINRYAIATITREDSKQVLFDLADLSHHSSLSVAALSHLKSKLKEKYHRFIRGDYSVREVLQKPFELAQFALSILTDSMNLNLPHGVKVRVESDIPIGCGMGSSAATILSVMQAVSRYLQLSLPEEKLFALALEAENMQHGQSSGLDLRVALNGGCLYVDKDIVEARPIPEFPLFLVNTGTPLSSTGQCVEKVAPYFASNAMKNQFAAVTRAMDSAIQQKSWSAMQAAVRENHALLVAIGVVPEKVQQFIQTIERAGGAAKVCGAGAIYGDHAGAVLVAMDDENGVKTMSERFGYNVIPIAGVTRGVHAA